MWGSNFGFCIIGDGPHPGWGTAFFRHQSGVGKSPVLCLAGTARFQAKEPQFSDTRPVTRPEDLRFPTRGRPASQEGEIDFSVHDGEGPHEGRKVRQTITSQ